MLKYNLFVIASPLQLLNAQEALKYFSLKNNILVIIDTAGLNNKIQIDKVLDTLLFKKIIRLENDSRKKSRFLVYVKLIQQLKKNYYHKVILGNFGSINHMIASNVRMEKLYLVDDGTITISIYEKLIKRFSSKFNIKKIRFYFFGLRTELVKELNYFTIFKLAPKENIEIIHNNYKYLKKKYNTESFKHEEVVYFLGQPLVENGLLREEDYQKYMRAIVKYFKGKKIIYIPHRSEINFKNITPFINDDFIVQESTIPVELLFLEKRIIPYAITSFVSTALFTLEEIFYEKTKIISFKIDMEKFLKERLVLFKHYEYLAKTSATIVEI